MAHLDLSHLELKPAPIVRYEIERDLSRAKQLFAAAVVSTVIILVMAAMFLTAVQ
jgi:hypothetical protein